MSVEALVSSMPAGTGSSPESLAWLQELLRSAMEAVAAAEGNPIPKANSLARLAGLYLKTCQVTELKRAQKQLEARVRELEEALGVREAERNERLPLPDTLAEFAIEAATDYGTPSPMQTRSRSVGEPAPAGLASTAGIGTSARGAHPPSRAPSIRRR